MGLAKFTEELEKEIASLQSLIAELRAVLLDIDMNKLSCGVRNPLHSSHQVLMVVQAHDPKAHLYVQMEQLRAIRDVLRSVRFKCPACVVL